jgi:NTE family protein
MSARPRIVLALGGGVARGWAHIGVIRTLVRAGYAPDVICGTSIGAVVGGLYVADKLDNLEIWARGLTARGIFGLLDFSFGGSGLFGGYRLAKLLEAQIGGVCFDNLSRPFAVVATELDTGREVWLRDGTLIDALRASYALPGVFGPVKLGGRWLVDGALVNPCPTSLARSYGGHVVIAVSLHSDVIGEPDDQAPSDDEPLLAALHEQAKASAGSWIRPDRLILQHLFAPGRDGPALSSVMLSALNILLDRVSRARLAGDPPDVLIAPRIAPIGLLEFHRAAETIELGAAAARDALPYIRHALQRLTLSE